MKNKKINAVRVWKQLEDLAVPRLRLSVYDRAVYSHLLRHSRLEGRQELRFSILWLARGACLSDFASRTAVRSLIAKGALRLEERSKAGHVVQVRLPEEIRSVQAGQIAAGGAGSLEKVDFLETPELREAIHRREGGRCFYCLRRLRRARRCLDHVVPRVRGGRNGYRNLVSSCGECNSQKREWRAEDFLRWLCREGQLSGEELRGRFGALARLAAGKLRPALPAGGEITQRRRAHAEKAQRKGRRDSSLRSE
jgi:hypothetical protein